MANTSALITKLEGQAWVRNSDGSLQPLRVGMRIPVDADIVTAAGSQLSLQGNEEGILQIAADQQLKLSDDLFQAAEPSEAAITNPVDADVNALITALNDGQDPLADLDPTAATLSGGEGAGSTYVRLASVIERTTPLALQYPRSISFGTEDFISGGAVAQDDEPAPPAQASIGSDAQTVYEAGLGNEATSETSSGTFSVSASDGIASVTIGGVSYSLAQLKGDVTLLPPVNTPDGTIKITGFVSDVSNQNGTVSYEYTLAAAKTHASGDGNNTLTDTIVVGVAGSGGVTSAGEIVITIVDDVPVANDDTGNIEVGGSTASGNVITDAGPGLDKQGADGAVVTKVEFGATSVNVPATGTTTINGAYGVLTLAANGTYSYARNEGSEGGKSDVFTYTLTDGDTDISTATLTINIGDGTPTIKLPTAGEDATVVNEKGLPQGTGELADSAPNSDQSEIGTGSFTITSADGISKLTINGVEISAAALLGSGTTPVNVNTPLGNTLTITGYNATTGVVTYSYTLLAGETHASAGTDSIFDNMTVTVTDSDNDTSAAGTLSVKIVDDVPVAVFDSGSLAAGQFGPVGGNVLTNDVFGADGKTVSTGGVVGVAAGNTGANLDSPASVGVVINGTYGKLTLAADGTYTYTRNPGSQGGQSDIFTYTIKDGDGDLAHTTLTITIGDSTPQIGGLTPQVDGGDTMVNEKGLPQGTGELADSAPNSDQSEIGTGSFTITSADGISKLTINGVEISAAALLGSGTTPVNVNTPLGNTLTITGYNATTGVVTYSYTLLAGETHASAGTDSIFDNMTVTVTDSDNDTSAAGTLSVKIVDDVPVAVFDSGSLAAGQFGPVGGNVLTNDVFGADGKTVSTGGVVGVAAGNTGANLDSPASVGVVINGTYGKLTLAADGTYTYTRNPGSQGGQSDIFTYTIKDGDGDLAHTTLTITIGDSTPQIGGLTPQVDGGDTMVNEKGLPQGTGELADSAPNSDQSEIGTGSFTITSADGISKLTINGVEISAAALLGSGTTPVNVNTPLGNTLTITGYNATTGVVTYSYTLLAGETHASAGTDSIFDNMTVTVTDSDNDTSAAGTLSVKIVDDVPVAVFDSGSLAAGQFGPVGGNVLTNDVFGADGKTVSTGGVVGVAAGNTGANLDSPASVGVVINGTYGKLTLAADGTYTYTRNPGSQGGQSDIFTYTIKDGDGDLAHTTLTITIGDSTPQIGGLTPQVDGGDTMVNEKGLPQGTGELADSAPNSDQSEIGTGSFTITSADGISKLTINGVEISAAALLGSGTTPVNVNTPLGNTLTITGYNATTGVVTYSYTLLAGETHASAGTDSIFDNMTVTVTDSDNDTSAAGTLSVKIVDDVPVVVADVGNVTEGLTLSVTAANGVLSNDQPGADGWASTGAVVGVQAGAVSGGANSSVGVEIQGAYGKLTLYADGRYTYKASSVGDAQTLGAAKDVFTYTVRDGDGDLQTTTLSINLNQFIGAGNGNDTITGGAGNDVIFADTGGINTVVVPGKNYNIALIVDTSGSMSNASGTQGKSRMELAIDALNNFVDSIKNHSGVVNVVLVDFDTGATSWSLNNVTASNVSQLVAKINALTADGGTNYEAAFNSAVTWFNQQGTAQSGGTLTFENKTYFLTDGDPTYYVSGGSTGGTGNSTDYQTMLHAVNAFTALSATGGVNAIGIGTGVNVDYLKFFDNTSTVGTGNVDFANTTTTKDLGNFSSSGDAGSFGTLSNWRDIGTGSSAGKAAWSYTGSGAARSLLIDDNNNNSAGSAVVASGLFTVDGNSANISFNYTQSGRNGGDSFAWKLQSTTDGGVTWTDVTGSSGSYSGNSNSQQTATITGIGAGSYQFVFTVNDGSTSGNYQVAVDNLSMVQEYLNIVTGPVGESTIVNTAAELAAALQGGSSTTTPAAVGNDTVNGGDGNDILFGDVINTDALSWSGRSSFPAGSGVDALKDFLKVTLYGGTAPTDAQIYDYIRQNHAQFDVAGDTRGGNDTLRGDAGNDILYGQGGTDTLEGGDGNDILYGGTGNDTLQGGKGNDTLIGGTGDDVFLWKAGDAGTAAAPALDVIKDFGTGSGNPNGTDKLDLKDLLVGENSGNLTNYLHFAVDAGNTVIKVSTTGVLGANGSGFDQQITLENVNLVNGVTDQSQIINNLIAQGKLDVNQ